jgi:DNA-binding NarL/FixJ family response regulator
MNILLADKQASERTALRRLLEEETELRLVGEAAEAEGLLTQAQAVQPDMVLLDWELPGRPTTDLLAALHALNRPPRVVVYGETRRVCREALAAGANAFVSKDEPPEWLLTTLHSVAGLSPCFAG